MSKQKSKSERAARGKIAVPPSEFLTDPVPPPPFPAPDTTPPLSPSFPSANGDEEAALERLADDGGPPSPPTETKTESPLGEAPEPPTALSLEQRVRRLEESVTLLQERRAAEPAIAAVLPPILPTVGGVGGSTAPPPTAIRLDVGKRPPVPAAPVAAVVPEPSPIVASSVTRGGVLWLLWDTWAEARAIVRMFVDPRYHLPRSARVLPLVLLAVILTSNIWVPFSSVPLLGGLLVNLVNLPLAFLLFKWLGHEARRYRQTSPDLPANLRL